MRAIVCLSLLGSLVAAGAETLRLEPAEHMSRADLYYVKTVDSPRAVLVLCPGCNGNGERLTHAVAWQDFARNNNLGLVGLSFASSINAIYDGSGYYYASKGSGEKLLEGIHKIYGKDLPLLLYGFSGGAHFTSRFEEWKPERVMAWCAYSAGWWDFPKKSAANPAGIVACGEDDERLGASLIYFKQGRAAGKPWLWVCLPKTGHSDSRPLDEFVRQYFAAMLSDAAKVAEIVDIDQKTEVISSPLETNVTLTAWLPSRILFEPWKRIHEP